MSKNQKWYVQYWNDYIQTFEIFTWYNAMENALRESIITSETSKLTTLNSLMRLMQLCRRKWCHDYLLLVIMNSCCWQYYSIVILRTRVKSRGPQASPEYQKFYTVFLSKGLIFAYKHMTMPLDTRTLAVGLWNVQFV